MKHRAYVVGRLQSMRVHGERRLVLEDIQITSEPAASLTCMDGTYWCDFGQPYEGASFSDALVRAEEHARGLRQWLGLKPYERK